MAPTTPKPPPEVGCQFAPTRMLWVWVSRAPGCQQPPWWPFCHVTHPSEGWTWPLGHQGCGPNPFSPPCALPSPCRPCWGHALALRHRCLLVGGSTLEVSWPCRCRERLFCSSSRGSSSTPSSWGETGAGRGLLGGVWGGSECHVPAQGSCRGTEGVQRTCRVRVVPLFHFPAPQPKGGCIKHAVRLGGTRRGAVRMLSALCTASAAGGAGLSRLPWLRSPHLTPC